MAKVNPIQVQKYLSGMDYPSTKEKIISHAKQQGADKNTLQTLQSIRGSRFESPADVSQAIGKVE